MYLALHVHKDRFAGGNVALELVRGAFKRHGFAGHHDGAAVFVMAAAYAQGADAKRVPKSQQAVAGDQSHHGVRALDALVHTAHSGKHIDGAQRQAAGGFFELVRQHVEQHFRVAVGVDVAVVGVKKLGLEHGRVGQVTVVREHQAKRRVDIKGLRFVFAESVARRRVTHLAQADIARQGAHVAGAKNVAHHALGLVHEKFTTQLRDDARRVLAAVLQQQKTVINQLIDRGVTDNTNYSAHDEPFIN